MQNLRGPVLPRRAAKPDRMEKLDVVGFLIDQSINQSINGTVCRSWIDRSINQSIELLIESKNE